MLYPLKFNPLLKERIWGGTNMKKFGKKIPENKFIGESWELSGVEDDVSVVSNGMLKGNSLSELQEVYMGDLVGERIFLKYGEEFPLLIKLIDAADVLSIQVHPDDKLAAERHNAYGKTEMWYVVDCEPGAALYVGFKKKCTKEEYLRNLEAGTLDAILNRLEVSPGDAYFIPAGTIHAIGKGIMVAEIQQTSDITYRVFDWNRTDSEGNPRELHTELALDAIDYNATEGFNVTVKPEVGKAVKMQSCKYFTSSVVAVDGELERSFVELDTFIIYVCLDGEVTIETRGGNETITKGETVLIPAEIDEVVLKGTAKLIEVYIPQ